MNNKPWESSKPWPDKESNSREYLKTMSKKSNKMKTTSEGWSTKFHKRKENSPESSKSWPERVTWTKINCFSWSRKSIRKEESPWLTNKRFKKCNRSSIQAANKLKKISDCCLKSCKRKEERVWLMKREPKIWKESWTKKFTSWMNSPEESLRMIDNWSSWRIKSRRKETRVWLMRLRSES